MIDAVGLQVLAGGLRAACDEMGVVLIRSSHSPNIKERRDCSTALFTGAGELVMQAEHIPVHLGSMPDAVAAILDLEQAPGREWILNDPYRGGTHLPDITLIAPIHVDGRLIGFAASRAHHADVGGPTPGGMPADSTRLDEEGVVIPPSELTEPLMAELVAQMRNPGQRLADLRAQRAANRAGAERLAELAERHGTDALLDGMEAVLDYAERRARAAIAELPDGRYSAGDVLEGGRDGELDVELAVTVEIAGERIVADLTACAAQVDGNLNCPASVTRSAVAFAVRALTDPDAPPCAGGLRPVEVVTRPGTIVDALPPAAVAGGNVETSCRIADLMIDALARAVPGAPAQGQGTMNNLTLAALGGDGFTYYETTGGGQGAGPMANGPSAVHVTMSNTLNTPIEALETEYPLRVTELSLRRGSGGAGARRGGDGIVREVEALEPMRFNLITERRRHAPRGRDGGEPGAPGRNVVAGAELPSKAGGVLEAGQRLRIETPGGGGFGTPAQF